VAFLGALPVAGAHGGGDLGPGRSAVACGLDEGQLAALEFGRQEAGGSERGERGCAVQATAQCCGGQSGERFSGAG
jgi:hypothetical protein